MMTGDQEWSEQKIDFYIWEDQVRHTVKRARLAHALFCVRQTLWYLYYTNIRHKTP